MKLYYFYTLKALWDGQGKIKMYNGISRVKKQLSEKRSIGTINVKNAMDNTMSAFVPFLITKEIDSTQMTKMVKILAQITSQPIREVFCCKLHILKFQTSVHKKKPKFACYSIHEVKGPTSVMNWEIILNYHSCVRNVFSLKHSVKLNHP